MVGQNILSIIFNPFFVVLLNDWGGGQQLEGDGREDILSLLENLSTKAKEEIIREKLIIDNNGSGKVTETANSQGGELQKGGREYALVESQVEENKEELVGDGDDQDVLSQDNESHWKNGVQSKKKTKREVERRQFVKPGLPKPVAEEGKEKPKKYPRKGKMARNVGQQVKRKSSKILEKEKNQLKREVSKLKEERDKIKKEIKRAKQKKRVIKSKEKETNCGRASSRDIEVPGSRDSECDESWAAFTSVGLAQAPNVIKQVENIFQMSPQS